MDAVRALIEVLRGCEEEPIKVKQEYKDTFNLNEELKKMSIPAKYKGPIQKLMDDQANVLSCRLAVAFKGQIKLVLLYFFNINPDVNGYAIDVVEMLNCGIVANPEDNLTNQLMDTEEVHVSELANLEVKVEEMDQDSTEVVLSPVVSSDDSQLQLSTTSHSNQDAMIKQLPQLLTPVLKQNTNNRPVMIEPPANISKKNMYKKLPLEPATCLVKDCGTKFDYRGFRQEHIDKEHQNTELACPLCPEHFTTYTTLDRHYQKKHAFDYQCTFPNCAFTSKTTWQVTKHFEESHMVSDIMDNSGDESTNRDSDEDDHLSEHEANSEENTNVQPIHQGSTAAVPFSVASGSDDPNKVPVVQQPSTSAEPKTMKRTYHDNEECDQVSVDGQGQSSASVKKAKLDSTQSNNAQSVDQSPRCMTDHCGLYFDNLDDLDQHIKLVHSHPNQFTIITVENGLTTVYGANDGNRPIVSQQSSISTEPTTSIHFGFPGVSRLESRDNDECIDVCDQGQSSSSVNNAKLDAAHSDHAQSQVTNVSEQNSKVTYNSTKEVPQRLNRDAMLICIGLKCFQLNCKRVFDTEEKLNHHMWKRHRIRAFPCLVNDCGKSFDDMRCLNEHVKKDHKDRSEWLCAICYRGPFQCLSDHYSNCHSALYQCAFASCAFMSENKISACNHYVREHMITCKEYGCANKFYGFIYKRHADVDREKQAKRLHYHHKPINQGSTASVSSHVESCDRAEQFLLLQQPSTSVKPKTTKRNSLQSRNNEEYNQVCVDGQIQSSASMRKAKLDSTQSNNAQVTSHSQQTANTKYNPANEEPQLLHKNAMFTCIGLKCFKLDCQRMLHTEKQITDHMWESHFIGEFACLVKDCNKSFNNRCNLINHIRKDHKNTSKLRSDKCLIHYSKQGLSSHYTLDHSAQYQCTFTSCTFTSEHITTTCKHYVREHMITCNECSWDCDDKLYTYVFKDLSSLAKHRGDRHTTPQNNPQ